MSLVHASRMGLVSKNTTATSRPYGGIYDIITSATSTATVASSYGSGIAVYSQVSPFAASTQTWSVYQGTTNATKVTSIPVLNGAVDFTWEFWVYFTSLPATGSENKFILCCRENNAHYTPCDMLIQLSSGTPKILYIASANNSAWSVLFFGSRTLLTNTWYHMALQKKGTAFECWINGTRDANYTYSSATLTNFSDRTYAYFGAQNNNGTFSFADGQTTYTNIKFSPYAVYASGATITAPTTPFTSIGTSSWIVTHGRGPGFSGVNQSF